MNQEPNYTVQYNIQDISPAGKERKPEVLQFHFKTFDEAFRKLYTTDINYFDRQAALASGLDTLVTAAMILPKGGSEPVLSVERTFDPADKGRREHFNTNASLYLTKGDTFNLMSLETRMRMREAEPLIGRDNVYPFAVYSDDGQRLSGSGQRIKDALQPASPRLQDLPEHNFSVDIRRRAFLDTVPPGAANGVVVTERHPVADLGTAMRKLLSTDIEIADPMIATNNGRHEFLTRMEVIKVSEQRTIAELKNFRFAHVRTDIPEPGLYVEYASRIHRQQAEQATPGLRYINGPTDTLVAPVARYVEKALGDDKGIQYEAVPVSGLKKIHGLSGNNQEEVARHRLGSRVFVLPDNSQLHKGVHP